MEFINEKQKKEALIGHLKRLKDHVGWQIILKALKNRIRITEAKLHGEMAWEEGDNLENLQKERNDRVSFIALPKTLVKEFEGAETFPVDLDPYS